MSGRAGALLADHGSRWCKKSFSPVPVLFGVSCGKEASRCDRSAVVNENIFVLCMLGLLLLMIGLNFGYWMHKRFAVFLIRNFMRDKKLYELGEELVADLLGRPYTRIQIVDQEKKK
jgi:hypothetical protein